MDVEELKREVARISWWHTIDLGHGVVTPGAVSHRTLNALGLPARLTGKTVLDIGAWDGLYSFEAERRGARRVLATDSFCWSGAGPCTKAGFELARRALGSRVEDLDIDVLDVSPERLGMFDLVLFLGVLYHMRHPLLALEKVASVTGEQLILESHVEMIPTDEPAMVFYPGTELNADPTNWWGPNPAAVVAMLKDVGFRKVQGFPPYTTALRSPHEKRMPVKRTRLERLLCRLPTAQPPRPSGYPCGRMVFHAWR